MTTQSLRRRLGAVERQLPLSLPGIEGGIIPTGRAQGTHNGKFWGAGQTSEWYTPAEFIEAAREVMGGIDLDPASCEHANQTVRAEHYYTVANDGLRQPWRGRVWMNPPYSDYSRQSADWCTRLLFEYERGNVTQAVATVNVTKCNQEPMQALIMAGSHMITRRRIKFNRPPGCPPILKADGSKRDGGSAFANVFFYLGPNADGFAQVFSRWGVVSQGVAPMTGS